MYAGSDFYLIYTAYKDVDVMFNEIEDIYEGTIDHVLCEFLVEVSRREMEPYLFDEIFIFIMFLAKALNEMNKTKEGQLEYIKR